MPFNNEIEKTKKEIEVLTKKLSFLEELSQTKTPCEEAYYAVYGWYPPTTSSVSNYEDNRWRDFQNGYNASKVSETPQEPEELKTLYQMFYENDWNVRSCEVFCNIVKEWMSQYTHNVMTGEYLKGYEECLTVLEENLK